MEVKYYNKIKKIDGKYHAMILRMSSDESVNAAIARVRVAYKLKKSGKSKLIKPLFLIPLEPLQHLTQQEIIEQLTKELQEKKGQ